MSTFIVQFIAALRLGSEPEVDPSEKQAETADRSSCRPSLNMVGNAHLPITDGAKKVAPAPASWGGPKGGGKDVAETAGLAPASSSGSPFFSLRVAAKPKAPSCPAATAAASNQAPEVPPAAPATIAAAASSGEGAVMAVSAEASESAVVTKQRRKIADDETDKTCKMCKDPLPSDHRMMVLRCKGCNGLKSRLQRLWVSEPDMKLEYDGMSLEAREKIISDNQDTLGNHELGGSNKSFRILKAKVEFALADYRRQVAFNSMSGSGEFMDEMDLTDKYKNKPDQLASVLTKARTMFDENRQVKLYEDVDYSGLLQAEETYVRELKRKYEAAREAQAAKTANNAQNRGALASSDVTAPAAPPAPKPLTPANAAKLENTSEKIETKLQSAEALIGDAECPRLAAFAPEYARTRATLVKDLVLLHGCSPKPILKVYNI